MTGSYGVVSELTAFASKRVFFHSGGCWLAVQIVPCPILMDPSLIASLTRSPTTAATAAAIFAEGSVIAGSNAHASTVRR